MAMHRCSCFLPTALALGMLACNAGGTRASAEPVGRAGPGRFVTPVNQVLTPVGHMVELAGLRPQALALSPDGSLLAVSGKTSELLILDAATGALRQRVELPSEKSTERAFDSGGKILAPDKEGQVSYTGLLFAPDGRTIYLSNVQGSVKVFAVDAGGTVHASHTLRLPLALAPRRIADIPAGLALSEDARRLYVCLNLSNRLAELDLQTGELARVLDVGVAPYDVVLAAGKAFVSCWGGRRPGRGDVTGPAGRGTRVRVDPVRHIASEGSVSVLDLATGKELAEIVTGLHACALARSPDGRFVVCANAGSDHLSVLDAAALRIVETIWTKPRPSDLFGASPNALAFDAAGATLYVANGTQNAIAVVRFAPAGGSRLAGLIPVGWFPGALAFDAHRARILAANIKGLTPGRARPGSGPELNSHQHHGSVSLVPVPSAAELEGFSAAVDANLRRDAIERALLPPRPGQPPRPVPERIGEPSVFRHVVYVIKENRTYDQVLGDLPRGNGDPTLCTFGEEVTPNQHALARQFVLLDNTYCAGILSADGHQWSTTAFATDYMEKSFAGFPRSYPDGMGVDEDDALAYSPGGFLWDNVLAHGLTLRNYGEFAAPDVRWRDPARAGSPDFLACWRAWRGESDAVIFASYPMVESLRPYQPSGYVGWEMAVPDQYRADFFLRELRGFEPSGALPALTIVCLPNDHTSGTSAGCPTPAACIADNDLAFGRIVEGLSHSRFWPHTLILAIEDDPQAGWDHVSGYRTTAYCVSPYTRRGAVVSTQYNTTSLIRTIEQVLGLPPMNQFDASATPMHDCFQDEPDWTPFVAVPSRVPLDQMNPAPAAIADPVLRADAVASARLDLRAPDRIEEDELNRILWRSARGAEVPYPEAAGHGRRE